MDIVLREGINQQLFFHQQQEMRIDDFSRNELRESHATMQELTSQIRELQERMNFMNDSRKFQDMESICSGKLFLVPSQPAVIRSPRSMLSRDHSLRSDTWSCLGHRETFFFWAIHEQRSIHHRHLINEFFTL